LLVVADNENCFAQIQRHQSHHVALAGLVNDDNIEARSRGSKFSTTRESGITQTGTAPRQSLIFFRASRRKRETRIP